MWELNPTLVLSFGEEIADAVGDSLVEASEYNGFILDHNLYQFLFFNPTREVHKNFAQRKYVGTFRVEDSRNFEFQKERITQFITNKFLWLQSYELPVEENRFAIKGGTAGAPRILNIFIASDLEESSSDLFTECFLPTFLNLLERQANRHFRLCLISTIGVFDEKNKPVVQKRLDGINGLAKKYKNSFPLRIYLLDKHAKEGTPIGSKSELRELVSLFLQNLLLSDINSPSIKQNIDFLTKGDMELPYSTFGISSIDFPTFQLIEYCSKKSFVQVAEEITKEIRKDVGQQGEKWSERCDLRTSIPISQIETPVFSPSSFSIFTENYRLKNRVNRQMEDCLLSLERWTKEKFAEIRRQTEDLKKESINNLKTKKDELKNTTLQFFRKLSGSLYSASVFVGSVLRRLQKRENIKVPFWSSVKKPDISRLETYRDKVCSAIDRRPLAKAVIFHGVMFFIVGVPLAFVALLPIYGLLKTIFLVSLLYISITFLMGLLILFIPHQSVRIAQKRLVTEFNSYTKTINETFRKNLSNIGQEYEAKALTQIKKQCDGDCQWVDLAYRLFKDKQKKFDEQIGEIERGHKKVIHDSHFRKFVLKEKAFPEIFRRQSEEISVTAIFKDFEENGKFELYRKVFNVTPYGLYDGSYDCIRKKYLRIKTIDYFSRNFGEYRNMLKERMRSESSKLLFYLVPIQAETTGTLDSRVFFSGKEDYREILAESELSLRPEIIIPLTRPNRVYLWKVMWGIPHKAVKVKS